jgi:DNA-binding NarL/FixJ family response regulator
VPRGDLIRVLLADDHRVVRDGLAQLLHTCDGIEVIAQASDGQEAVDLARQVRPDVVVMDVSMPRLDGIEATRRLRAEMPDLCVIGLSMHTEPNVAEAMTAAGATAYLAKSAPPESLVAAILKHHATI